ncbi:hypothetical protein O181_124459 [Austropuccinia psidii MF-1]|uniref:Uncharacterized protein n=1 Tax=Austropuccinia psidii MF-1 TaxID=1389203 RepID=A0A9Q3KPG7_9BASI|nr:hypothetical protein [Austropuccinia psidii MF-1]
MVTIGPSLNVLSPLPSFIGQIITSLRSRSEVTIGGGVDKSTLDGTGLIVRNLSQCPFALGYGSIIVDHEGVLARASWARTPLAVWSEGADNKQTSLVCLSARITSVSRRRGTNAGDTPLGA